MLSVFDMCPRQSEQFLSVKIGKYFLDTVYEIQGRLCYRQGTKTNWPPSKVADTLPRDSILWVAEFHETNERRVIREPNRIKHVVQIASYEIANGSRPDLLRKESVAKLRHRGLDLDKVLVGL